MHFLAFFLILSTSIWWKMSMIVPKKKSHHMSMNVRKCIEKENKMVWNRTRNEQLTKILNHRIADSSSAKWSDSRNNKFDLVDTEQRYSYCYGHPMSLTLQPTPTPTTTTSTTMIVDFSVFWLMSMSVMLIMTTLGCQFVQSFALQLCWYFSVMTLNRLRLMWLMVNRLLKVMLTFYYSSKVIRSRIAVQCQFSREFVVVPCHIQRADDVMYHRRPILMDLMMDSWNQRLVVVDSL